jgi:hypothetical protein
VKATNDARNRAPGLHQFCGAAGRLSLAPTGIMEHIEPNAAPAHFSSKANAAIWVHCETGGDEPVEGGLK